MADAIRIKMYKFEVPVDGEWHEIELVGPEDCIVQHVGVQHRGVVAFWSAWTDHSLAEKIKLEFRAYRTGEEFDLDSTTYHGTVLDGPYVWHLISRPSKEG